MHHTYIDINARFHKILYENIIFNILPEHSHDRERVKNPFIATFSMRRSKEIKLNNHIDTYRRKKLTLSKFDNR